MNPVDDHAPPPDLPGVCVVVATYQRAHLLPPLVAALRAQTHPDLDVVVVDNGSSDGTGQVLAELTAGDDRIRVLRIDDNRGPARARNLGWRSSDRPWVAFTDDDCRPDPDWAARLVATAVDTGAGIVQGTTIPPAEDWEGASRFDRSQEIRSFDRRYQTCNLLVARDLLERLDGFNETFRIAMGEDTDLGLRAEAIGTRTAFAADARVVHLVVRRGYLGYLKDRWRWADIVALVRENPDARQTFTLGYFAGEMHVVATVAVPVTVVALWSGWWQVPVAGVLAWCAARTWQSRRRDESAPRRFALAGLELVGVAWEVACFAAASIRYRRLVL